MRIPRYLVDGAEYHVTARINRQEHVLEPALIKNLFLQVLKDSKKRYRFTVRNFCIMDNHVHLMLRPASGESLSRIMQWILSVFAMRYNRMRNISGHVWHDRFRSKIITNMRQMIKTFIYIAENPVKSGKTTAAILYAYGGVGQIAAGNREIVSDFESVFFEYYRNRAFNSS